DVFLLLKHLAIVGKHLGAWIPLCYLHRESMVRIANGNNVFAFQLGKVARTLTANADSADVQFLARRFSGSAQHVRGNNHQSPSCRGSAANEGSATHLF